MQSLDNVLAINTDEDASIAVLRHGVIHLVELDRLMRVKHYGTASPRLGRWPSQPAIDKAFPNHVQNTCVRLFTAAQRLLGVDPAVVADTTLVNSPNCAYVPEDLNGFIRRLLGHPVDFIGHDHPTSHVEEVIMVNNLREGSAVALDAVGDGCGAVFTVRGGTPTERTRRHVDSFGELYGLLTSFFMAGGGDPTGLEGSFMAFAGLGPRAAMNDHWRRLRRLTAPHLVLTDDQRRACMAVLEDAVADHGVYAAARACQEAWVDEVVEYIAAECTHGEPLVFAGGCALNCPVNQRLVESGLFPNIGWSPSPGDGGQPVGILLQRARALGVSVNGLRVETMGVVDPDWWAAHRGVFDVAPLDVDQLVDWLINGRLVGVCRGPVERGPRALGRRSILATPLDPAVKDRLNGLKGRQAWRPFGVVLPLEHLRDFTDARFAAPWMNVTIDPPAGLIPAAEHVDGSTRVQTVTAEADPWLHGLLTAVGDRTGVYALINTSLNGPGMPIANYVEDMVPLLDRGLDALVLEDEVVRKR